MFNLLISSHWHSTSHHSYLPCLLLSPFSPSLSLSVSPVMRTSPCLRAFTDLLICVWVWSFLGFKTRQKRLGQDTILKAILKRCVCCVHRLSVFGSVQKYCTFSSCRAKSLAGQMILCQTLCCQKQFENSHSSLMTKNLVYSRTRSYVLLLASCQREQLQQAVRAQR